MMSIRECAMSLLLAAVSVSCLAQTSSQDTRWIGTWGSAPSPAPATRDVGSVPETVREIVHVSAAGRSIRIRISNAFGTEPLRIEHASVALRQTAADLKSAPVLLRFNGSEGIVVPAAGSVVSDGASLDVPSLSDVAVSIFVPAQPLTIATTHPFADTTNYIAPGDQVMSKSLSEPSEYAAWPFLLNVDVGLADDHRRKNTLTGTVVCLGDSITAGFHSTMDANDRWPDELSIRLQANEATKQIGVLNEGIGGNRIRYNRVGPSALSRFDRDVLSQTNVKYLIVLEGINDINAGYRPRNPKIAERATAQELEAAYTKMAAQAHARGIKVIGATLTPFGNAAAFSDAGEALRKEVNEWIRTTALTSHTYDGVVDFDHALRANNGSAREILSPLYDSGDGLHPNDAGYKAMGETIPLSLFTH